MKILRSMFIVLAIGAATISTANARDSFSLGINIGGYGYAPPPVVYYPAPVYYDEPVVYYRPAPRYYSYAPTIVSLGYQNYGGYRHHGHHDGWGRGRGHHGWGHGGWDRGGRGDWDRGGRGHDHHGHD